MIQIHKKKKYTGRGSGRVRPLYTPDRGGEEFNSTPENAFHEGDDSNELIPMVTSMDEIMDEMNPIREEMEATMNFLNVLDLHGQPEEKGFGIPDLPGLADLEARDKVEGPSLQSLAWRLVREAVHVDFIKGFVSSRDAMTGDRIEELRKSILQEYSDSVFCWSTGGNPPPVR